MQLHIQARQFALTEAIRQHVEKRFRFAGSARFEQIRRVMVRLSDINGPRGGKDKRCHIQVVLAGQSDVVIEETQNNLYSAIDRAAQRAGRTVSRRLAKLRNNGLRKGLVPAQFEAAAELLP